MTIFDSSDLASAIQSSRTLKLTVFVNSQSDSTAESAKSKGNEQKSLANVQAVRRELVEIRDRVIHLLDQLDLAAPQQQSTGASAVPSAAKDSPTVNSHTADHQTESKPATGHPPISTPKPIHAKEFDPYQQQQPDNKQWYVPLKSISRSFLFSFFR